MRWVHAISLLKFYLSLHSFVCLFIHLLLLYFIFFGRHSHKIVLKILSTFFPLFIFSLVLPSSGISTCVMTDRGVMPPNLARPCYVALGWALYMWLLSRNSIVHQDWGRTLVLHVKATIRLSLKSASHRIQRDSNPQPFDHEANELPS